MKLNQRGAIIFVYLLIVVLIALGGAILLRGANESKVSLRHANSSQAFWVAESGVQKTLWELNYNNCASFVQQGTSTVCTDCSTCGSGNKTVAATISNSGDYDIVMDKDNTTATAIGSQPSRTSTNKTTRSVKILIGQRSPFDKAAFGATSLTVDNNALIDSYSSANNGVYGGANIGSNGDIGTNSGAAGAIDVGNNITIKGDAGTGSGGTVTMGNGSSITGTTSATISVPMPNVVVPTALTGLSNGGKFTVNTTDTIPAGDYQYSALDLKNGAALTITGDVRLYLTSATSALDIGNNSTLTISDGAKLTLFVLGPIDVSNKLTVTNAGGKPESFQIYSKYTGADGVKFGNNGSLAAAIYAPQTDVVLGNGGDFYGSIVGETVELSNNGAVHYDEVLATIATPIGIYIITKWEEL